MVEEGGKQGHRGISYSHMMRWEQYDVANSEGRAWIKTLSLDPATGSRTALIRYDAGFKQAKTKTEAPVDMYVIDGEAKYGDKVYEKATYAYHPPGTEIGPIESPKGMTRLIFRGDPTKCDKEPVFIQDTRTMPWRPNYDDPTGTGKHRGVKDLRVDKTADYKIIVICHFQVGWRAQKDKAHIHDHIEEAFLLEGRMEDWLGEAQGHLQWVPGFYVCREPYHSPHGDVTVLEAPVLMIARREWTGLERDLRSADWKQFEVPEVVFSE